MKVQSGLKVTTPSDLEIVMTRTFNAPRKLVWEAMTRPDLVRRWLFSPPGWNMSACEMDNRVGGKFRWEWTGPDGGVALTIWGENREVSPPAKVVHTECMKMGPGAGGNCPPDESGEPWELLATVELTEEAGQTLLRMTLLFPSKQARDGALASGMEHGVGAGYNTLEGLLVEME
jgi:uncharacterized protein YndB with AHSA1/START domain